MRIIKEFKTEVQYVYINSLKGSIQITYLLFVKICVAAMGFENLILGSVLYDK